MANCPFCSNVLLRHVRAGEMYWFCRRCRVEVLQTNARQDINLSTPIDRLWSGSQTNVKLNEPSSPPLMIHKD